jgi:hypothetical protein
VAQSEWTWSWTLSSKRFTWIHAQSRSFTSARLSTARDSNLQRVHLPWPSPWRINETRCHNHATWPLRSHMNGSARSGIIAFVRDDWSVANEKLSAQRSRVRRCRVSRIGPALPLGQSTLREVLMCCMFSPHARSTSTSLGICTHFSGRVATRAASCSRKKLSDAPTKFRPMRPPLRLRPRTLSSRNNNRGMPRRNANAQTFYGVHPYQLAVDSTRKRCHYYAFQYHRRTMFNTLRTKVRP